MLTADAELRAAAAAAEKPEADDKFDVTSSQDRVPAASSPLLGEASNDLKMENNLPETKCTCCFCIPRQFRMFSSSYVSVDSLSSFYEVTGH